MEGRVVHRVPGYSRAPTRIREILSREVRRPEHGVEIREHGIARQQPGRRIWNGTDPSDEQYGNDDVAELVASEPQPGAEQHGYEEHRHDRKRHSLRREPGAQ